MSAGALVVIALTVLALSLWADWSDGARRVQWTVTIAVSVEVVLALAAAAWLARQIGVHARTMDAQQAEVAAQAATLQEQAARLEAANRQLTDSVKELEASRTFARDEARTKARVAALLDAALGSSPIAFGFLDRDLRFLRVNPTLAGITERAPEDHVGATIGEVQAWLARGLEPALREVLATRAVVKNVELAGPAAHGVAARRNWLASCFPIVTAEGEVFGAGIAVTDVTEFKRLEEQFLQAQKMEAVGRLAGGVAHDFNNLLTVISSYAELILYDPAMQRSKGELEEIRGAAARAAKLTRQLLAFSRRQALEPRIVNPNDVLRGVEHLARGLVVGNIEIETRLSGDTPLIRVDPGQLEQVVMNLTINAADAMPDGGRLEIETAGIQLDDAVRRLDPELHPGQYAMIRVRDTGHGMTDDVLAQIFEPFFTTKELGRGTGLGLSTAHGIVKQSGGHIEVATKVGEGSAFTVYLPAVDGDQLTS